MSDQSTSPDTDSRTQQDAQVAALALLSAADAIKTCLRGDATWPKKKQAGYLLGIAEAEHVLRQSAHQIVERTEETP